MAKRPCRLGAFAHATEIPFVFDTVDAEYGDKLTPADAAMSKKVHAYWVAFAKAGTPSPTGLPAWKTQNPQTDFVMNFTNDGVVAGPDPWHNRLDLIQAMVEEPAKTAVKWIVVSSSQSEIIS